MSKNIAIRDDVYERLYGLKSGHESFSDVIEGLIPRKKDPLRYFASLAEMSPEERKGIESAEKELEELKKVSRRELLYIEKLKESRERGGRK